MPATGIKLSDEAISKWNEIRLHGSFRYILFHFNEQMTEVNMTKIADRNATLDDFYDELPPRGIMYAIYQFSYLNDDGHQRSKTVFISWAPDTASAKLKMVCAGTKSTVKRSLGGIAVDIHAPSFESITEDAILERCKAHSH